MSDNIIQLNEELITHDSKDLVRSSVEETLNALLDTITWYYREPEDITKDKDTLRRFPACLVSGIGWLLF